MCSDGSTELPPFIKLSVYRFLSVAAEAIESTASTRRLATQLPPTTTMGRRGGPPPQCVDSIAWAVDAPEAADEHYGDDGCAPLCYCNCAPLQ